jgi:hypothetical protein
MTRMKRRVVTCRCPSFVILTLLLRAGHHAAASIRCPSPLHFVVDARRRRVLQGSAHIKVRVDDVIVAFQIPSTAKPETPADSKSKLKQNLEAKKEEDKPVQGAA